MNAYLAEQPGRRRIASSTPCSGLQNPDYEIEPWTPADSVAWLKAMAWDLRSNIENETERAVLAAGFTEAQIGGALPGLPVRPEPRHRAEDLDGARVGTAPDLPQRARARGGATATREATLGHDPPAIEWTEVDGVIEAVSALVGEVGEGIGSNSWVVSGSLTETGMPLLANDPHLGASLPSVWHQIG